VQLGQHIERLVAPRTAERVNLVYQQHRGVLYSSFLIRSNISRSSGVADPQPLAMLFKTPVVVAATRSTVIRIDPGFSAAIASRAMVLPMPLVVGP